MYINRAFPLTTEEEERFMAAELSQKRYMTGWEKEPYEFKLDQTFPIATGEGIWVVYHVLLVPEYYPIWSLESDKLRLKDNIPLTVCVKKEGDLFFVFSEEFNISGTGMDKEEAVKDFIDFLIHDYFSYKNTPQGKLSPEARKLLEQYKNGVEEK